jgi:hypothetical protein
MGIFHTLDKIGDGIKSGRKRIYSPLRMNEAGAAKEPLASKAQSCSDLCLFHNRFSGVRQWLNMPGLLPERAVFYPANLTPKITS